MAATLKKILSALVLGALLTLGAGAHAQTLEQAKSSGWVGERANGYLGVVQDAPGVRKLVDSINLQRRQQYRDIARRNATSLDAVEAIVGQKLIERAEPGEYVENPAGGWVRK